ncbi:hypothetical protein K443DRAFT_102894, partial [Laccaria amethystina LaAM-08-1]
NDLPSLRNMETNRSSSAFGFVRGNSPLPEIKVDMNGLPSLRNMATNRSNSAFGFKLRLTCKFLLDFYVLRLYLTRISSGTTTRVDETWRPTVQIRRSVLNYLPSLRNMAPNRLNSTFGSAWK